jgi:hypothetical protein
LQTLSTLHSSVLSKARCKINTADEPIHIQRMELW